MGKDNTFDSAHVPASFTDSNPKDNDSTDESDSYDSDKSDDDVPSKAIDGPINLNMGTTNMDGLRRSVSNLKATVKESTRYMAEEHYENSFHDLETCMEFLCAAGESNDINIAPYLPEPKKFHQVLQCPPSIRDDWIKTIKKEVKFIIENETFRRGEKPMPGDEIIPSIIIFKAKITSKGFLDKLKAHLVARGDFQSPSTPEETWAPCVFGRTFKNFVT